MSFFKLQIVSLIIWSCLIHVTRSSKTRHYKWNVEYMFWSPDCIENIVMGINGQFPGPTIRAKVGDIVHVQLTNKLHTEGVVIHWHGIRQFGTPWADGTASISQCAISPGSTFVYRFKVDKAGTYFYHGHYGMQRSAGLYGSLIVDLEDGKKEAFHYDGEINLLLSDWWHTSSQQQEVLLSSKPFIWIGEPQSLLINGRGQYNCSLAAHYSNSSATQCKLKGSEQCAPQILHVESNKTYRIRLASTTSLSSLNFQIGNHKMVVVEADGNYVHPFTTSDLDIYSGESYSVLLTADQLPSQNYWISVSVRGRKPATPQALTLLNYHPTPASHFPSSPPSISPAWDDYNHSKSFTFKILAHTNSPKPPENSRRRIVLLNTQNKISRFIKWAVNNVSLLLPETPYLGSIKYGIKSAFSHQKPQENFPENYNVMKPALNPNATFGNGVYMLKMNQTVDIILQNANALNEDTSEIHPWHLHGHDFWVLGYGEGRFSVADEKKYNLRNPVMRNSVVIFPYGWTALRFVADNPGVWPFHCHIEPHLHMGMGVILAEGVEFVKGIPKDAINCGLTGKMMMGDEGN